jgi:hypothetical protein
MNSTWAELVMNGQIIAILFLSVLVCSLGLNVPAHSQAGSTGGTIGKSNKSVSGGEPEIQNAHTTPGRRGARSTRTTKKTTKTGCNQVVGTWTWLIGTTSLNSDHTVSHSWGNHGTWTCADRVVTITWGDGNLDKLTVAADGTTASDFSVKLNISFASSKL